MSPEPNASEALPQGAAAAQEALPGAAPASVGRPPASGLRAWLLQGLRTAFFMRPHWPGLRATPVGVAGLVGASIVCTVLLERLYVPGPASFYAPAFESRWWFVLVLAGCAWALRASESSGPRAASPDQGPEPATLFALLWLQCTVLSLLAAVVLVPAVHLGAWNDDGFGGATVAGVVPFGWFMAAVLALAARSAAAPAAQRRAALSVLAAAIAYGALSPGPRYWYPEREPNAATEPSYRLAPEQLEAQPQVLANGLAGLSPERPGLIDVYVLTFAPYADEDVFKRESALVAEVMTTRFDAEGRTLQLVNHRTTLDTRPLATARNLRRAIEAAAARMNRDEDILFLHLTSHGAHSGELSARLWPLDIDGVRPEQLKTWLDAAGVKRRIVSVSACYSGSWIAPLADECTLVMTAADAEHTSYGCGRKSELTYFGRALFDEELRKSWSFEQAHAAARTVIERREREAGKTDGYSNPQLHLGSAMREALAALEAQLAARPRP
jgi:hypothetical protein